MPQGPLGAERPGVSCTTTAIIELNSEDLEIEETDKQTAIRVLTSSPPISRSSQIAVTTKSIEGFPVLEIRATLEGNEFLLKEFESIRDNLEDEFNTTTVSFTIEVD